MQAEVATYLDEVRTHLHLDPHTESRVISSCTRTSQEKVSDLQEKGAAEPEATREALASFGGARSIARLTYEAYSRGSWMEALIGCQPHLIVAALFATHVWRQPVLLGAAFAAIVLTALLGSRRGTPTWLYSWMGYAVFPFVILTGMSWDPVVRTVTYVALGTGTPAPIWELGMLGALCIFTIWLVASTMVKIAKRDWILASLMLLPLPVLVIWLLTISQSDAFIFNVLRGFEARFRPVGHGNGVFLRDPRNGLGPVHPRSTAGSQGGLHPGNRNCRRRGGCQEPLGRGRVVRAHRVFRCSPGLSDQSSPSADRCRSRS